jgi:hypothetical protein
MRSSMCTYSSICTRSSTPHTAACTHTRQTSAACQHHDSHFYSSARCRDHSSCFFSARARQDLLRSAAQPLLHHAKRSLPTKVAGCYGRVGDVCCPLAASSAVGAGCNSQVAGPGGVAHQRGVGVGRAACSSNSSNSSNKTKYEWL